MGHSIINDARNAAGGVPKVYFYSSDKPLMDLPICSVEPIDLTTTILSDEDHGRKNPFKERSSFSIEIALDEELPFKNYISQDVADLCNVSLPLNAQSRCINYNLLERLFDERLWASRYLANLNYNKKKYEEDIKRMARHKMSMLDRLYYGSILLEAYFR